MKLFLDSCVILSRLPREILFALARQGYAELCYSQSIIDETFHVAKRKGIEADIAAAFIDFHLITGGPALELDKQADFWLPDENDEHVVRGALAANADVIVTENLRDFPKAALLPLGLEALSPDQLFIKFWAEHDMGSVIRNIETANCKTLKKAKLYRTAKLFPSE